VAVGAQLRDREVGDGLRAGVLTSNGVLTAASLERELGENRHVLSPLFYAAQELITETRTSDYGMCMDVGATQPDIYRTLKSASDHSHYPEPPLRFAMKLKQSTDQSSETSYEYVSVD
jgi:hypothetical protein